MKRILLFLVVVAALSGCRFLNPSLMLKTPKDYQYAEMKDSVANLEYRISANDIINFRLYSNDGFKLTDVTSATTTTGQNINQSILQYPVDIDGFVKLPVLGRTLLKGLTTRQAEKVLEEKYSLYYIRPFIMLNVPSRRVIIFPGEFGASKILPLEYNNTTLFEALAMAGGLPFDGKAYAIKLIRRTSAKPEVYHIDLSTIDGLKEGNIILQANDIIYVENRLRITNSVLNELAPFLSVVSSILLVYELDLLVR
jgi:polysaccharide export outer membrane protein